jgi:hypothetical protein
MPEETKTPEPTKPSTPQKEAKVEYAEIGEPAAPTLPKLKAYAERMASRVADVEKIFKDTAYDPTKNKDFTKFLKDGAAEMAMRYVLLNRVDPADEVGYIDPKAEALKKAGFTVTGGQQLDNEGLDDDTTNAGSGDDAILSTPAASLAIELGFNPNAKLDDEED